MVITFPSGNDPFTFSDTLPTGSTDTSAASIGAQQTEPFTTSAPAGSMFLTFVILAYPNANNSGGAAPLVPLVEILTQPLSGGADPWQLLQSTVVSGDRSISLPSSPGSPLSVDYTFTPLTANGVFQIHFKQNGTTNFDGLAWTVRFTVNDGLTTPAKQTAVTFVVDTANTQAAWLAVPGQLTLPPGPIDIAAGLAGITLAGIAPSVTPKQLIAGRSYMLSVPVGNYGTGPLTVTAITAPAVPNNFTMALAAPVTIPPGSADVINLRATFNAPPTGQTGTPATAATFTLTSNDPLAASTGATAHFNTVPLYASAGNFEIVLVLDLSGSMATADAGGQTRWFQLQAAVGQITTSLTNFAAKSDLFGAVFYPSANGNSVGQTLLKQAPIDPTLPAKVVGLLPSTPTDSTPMAGTAGAPGGIYTAMGLPTNPATDCGIFLPSVSPGFPRNYRWMVLMSDGMSNVGDDPKSIAPAYFTSRNIQAITIGYGKPGSGQVDPTTLQAVADLSMKVPTHANYFAADQTGLPSQSILMQFEKTVASALGLSFAADPDAVVKVGATNKHTVIVAEYDTRAAFVVCCVTPQEARLLRVTLITPLGETVTPSTAPSFALTYHETALSKGYYASQTALHDAPQVGSRIGTWTIVVTGGNADTTPPSVAGAVPSVAPSAAVEALRYAYQVSVDSDLSLTVGSTHHDTPAGDPIEIVAGLSLYGRPLLGSHLTAQLAGSGQGFDNWLASQTVTPAEYTTALRGLVLGGLQDVQALFVKTQALAAKGIFFPGTAGMVTQTLVADQRTGTYRTSFAGTLQPGTYSFLIVATGKDDKGNLFQRQQTWTTVVTARPDAASTLVSITYQVVGTQMQAILRVWPRDRFNNVLLVDPAVSQAIQVLLSGGAVASGKLTWNLDASYSQTFTFPTTATPGVSITAGGVTVLPVTPLPDFSKLKFVDQVVQFIKGHEAKAGASAHTDATKALGDPSRKPLTDFVSLGGLGLAEFAVKGQIIHATAVIVFIALDADLRAYAVDVLPALAGVGWIEIGRSRGVTQRFGLTPARHVPPDTTGWEIEVSGHLAGETFDVKIPVTGRLHAPVDPLSRIGKKGILAVRVRDLSNRATNPDGSPSLTPGVSIQGLGLET